MRAKGGTPSSGESAAGRLHRGRAVDEGELIRRVRAGERDAFAALIARYGGALLRFARLLVHDEVTAREMVQDAWLAVLYAMDGLEERAAFRTWLFRILASRAKTTRDGRAAPLSAGAGPSAHEPAVEPGRFDVRGMWADPPARWTDDTPEKLALRRETRAVMEAAIDELPPAQKALLVLRDLEGLEMDEIRDLLDIAVANQRVLLHRARARVRRALEAHERSARAAGSMGPREGCEARSAARNLEGA